MASNWLITGASRGLGMEIARAALAAGETVIATARSANDVTEALGSNCRLHALALDITDEGAAVAVAQEAVELVGRIDVLVNNAGKAQLGWFETISSAKVRRQFEVNVFGTMNVTRAAVPHMRARQSGLIITISSVNGLLANPGGSIYASSKFAVEGWIEGFAQELAPLNIKSMVVEPGMLRTDFLDDKSAEHGDIEVPGYAEATRQFRLFIAAANHNQPGDPVMLAERIVSLSMSNEPPARFVFGEDAQEWATDKVNRLKIEVEQSVNIANGS